MSDTTPVIPSAANSTTAAASTTTPSNAAPAQQQERPQQQGGQKKHFNNNYRGNNKKNNNARNNNRNNNNAFNKNQQNNGRGGHQQQGVRQYHNKPHHYNNNRQHNGPNQPQFYQQHPNQHHQHRHHHGHQSRFTHQVLINFSKLKHIEAWAKESTQEVCKLAEEAAKSAAAEIAATTAAAATAPADATNAEEVKKDDAAPAPAPAQAQAEPSGEQPAPVQQQQQQQKRPIPNYKFHMNDRFVASLAFLNAQAKQKFVESFNANELLTKERKITMDVNFNKAIWTCQDHIYEIVPFGKQNNEEREIKAASILFTVLNSETSAVSQAPAEAEAKGETTGAAPAPAPTATAAPATSPVKILLGKKLSNGQYFSVGGGKYDIGVDQGPLDTAAREAHEESYGLFSKEKLRAQLGYFPRFYIPQAKQVCYMVVLDSEMALDKLLAREKANKERVQELLPTCDNNAFKVYLKHAPTVFEAEMNEFEWVSLDQVHKKEGFASCIVRAARSWMEAKAPGAKKLAVNSILSE